MIYILIGLILLTVLSGITSSQNKKTTKLLQQQQKTARPPLTDAENEAIRQAKEAFDFDTQIAIVKGTYTGPLPEHVAFDKWTDLYPELYHTKIAGINFRKDIRNLAYIYFDAMLIPEPTNKHDKNAIKIVHAEDGRLLGYIPAEETDDVRKWVNNQFPYPCRAFIDECEEWYDVRERERSFLVGEINIQRPTT